MLIVGAGLAGLISANVFPQARIIEAQGRDKLEHKALLRFRTNVVANATGIEFRKVRVNKGVWHRGAFAQPSIQLANLYSQKVIGKLADRSIWNLESVERYIAPEDFISQLMDNCGKRIEWNCSFDPGLPRNEPVISTMPMPVLVKLLCIEHQQQFGNKPIHVARYHIPNADVFQTIYFTDPSTPVYRASISGQLLIVEAMDDIGGDELEMVIHAFGISHAIDPLGHAKQTFGKIASINDVWRKNFILRASLDHNIYSVGRFATWRNILLDDVINDLAVVKRLIKQGHYQHIQEMVK